MKLDIYTKTVCPQCTPVKVYLKRNQIEHEMHNIDNNEQAYEKVKELGFQSAPVLIISDETGIVKTSAGRDAALAIMEWHKGGLV